MTAAEMVREFHEAIGAPVLDSPTLPTSERANLRYALSAEEGSELLFELTCAADEGGDLVKIAKELADVLVVTYGAALEFGIDLDAVLAEVHRSNMAKVGGPVRADGKQLKPEGWKPPDVAGVLYGDRFNDGPM